MSNSVSPSQKLQVTLARSPAEQQRHHLAAASERSSPESLMQLAALIMDQLNNKLDLFKHPTKQINA